LSALSAALGTSAFFEMLDHIRLHPRRNHLAMPTAPDQIDLEVL
jgi:hypothetical protein